MTVPPAFIFALGVAWGIGIGLVLAWELHSFIQDKAVIKAFIDREQKQGRWMG